MPLVLVIAAANPGSESRWVNIASVHGVARSSRFPNNDLVRGNSLSDDLAYRSAAEEPSCMVKELVVGVVF